VKLSTVAVAAAALLVGAAARAAGDAEWQVSARLGAASVSVENKSPWELTGAVDLEYGLTDAIAGRVSLGTGVPGRRVVATTALVGATYTFDVLRLVPYGELSLGLVHFGGVAVQRPHTTLATELGVGADYLITPRWAAGVSFQYLLAPADLVNHAMELGQSPFAFSTALRGSFIF
jgi:outer membrane protein W